MKPAIIAVVLVLISSTTAQGDSKLIKLPRNAEALIILAPPYSTETSFIGLHEYELDKLLGLSKLTKMTSNIRTYKCILAIDGEVDLQLSMAAGRVKAAKFFFIRWFK